jgi:hypothetical protein
MEIRILSAVEHVAPWKKLTSLKLLMLFLFTKTLILHCPFSHYGDKITQVCCCWCVGLANVLILPIESMGKSCHNVFIRYFFYTAC